MGNYRARRTGFIEAWKIAAAEYMFQGKTDAEIVGLLWPAVTVLEGDDYRKQMRNRKTQLQKLRKDAKFQEYYQTLITEWRVHAMGPALAKLKSQMDSGEPWLENKAANDVLNRVGTDPFAAGADANAVTIRFEGMPELGMPSDDDDA